MTFARSVNVVGVVFALSLLFTLCGVSDAQASETASNENHVLIPAGGDRSSQLGATTGSTRQVSEAEARPEIARRLADLSGYLGEFQVETSDGPDWQQIRPHFEAVDSAVESAIALCRVGLVVDALEQIQTVVDDASVLASYGARFPSPFSEPEAAGEQSISMEILGAYMDGRIWVKNVPTTFHLRIKNKLPIPLPVTITASPKWAWWQPQCVLILCYDIIEHWDPLGSSWGNTIILPPGPGSVEIPITLVADEAKQFATVFFTVESLLDHSTEDYRLGIASYDGPCTWPCGGGNMLDPTVGMGCVETYCPVEAYDATTVDVQLTNCGVADAPITAYVDTWKYEGIWARIFVLLLGWGRIYSPVGERVSEAVVVPAGGQACVSFYPTVTTLDDQWVAPDPLTHKKYPPPQPYGRFSISHLGASTAFQHHVSLREYGPPQAYVADVRVTPRTLNLDSNGRWITAVINPPSGISPSEVNINTVKFNSTVYADRDHYDIKDADPDCYDELVVKFDRKLVQSILDPGDEVPVTVSWWAGGRFFISPDTIRVIKPKIVSPGGGELYELGYPVEITWEPACCYGAESVEILCSYDNGLHWETISEIAGNLTSYIWAGPDQSSAECRIMIQDIVGGEIAGCDITDGTFSSGLFAGVPEELKETDAEIGQIRLSPRPSRGHVMISYQLAQSCHVNLDLYDSSGRLVRTLVERVQEAGPQTVVLSFSGGSQARVAPGIYFVRLEAGEHTDIKKCVVLQ